MSTLQSSHEPLEPGLSIVPRARGRSAYRSTVYGPQFSNGQQSEFWFTDEITRTEARKRHAIRQGEAKKYTGGAITDKPISQVKDECYAYRREELLRAGKNTGTIDNYETAWRKRIATDPIGKKKLSQITRGDCLRFLRSLRRSGLAPLTQNGTVSALRAVLRYARENEYMDASFDPFRGIPTSEFPDQDPLKEGRALEPDEITRFIAALRSEKFLKGSDTVYVWMIIVNLYTGQRSSETCGLRWENVDLAFGIEQLTDGEEREPCAFITTDGQLARTASVNTPVATTGTKWDGEARGLTVYDLAYEALLEQLKLEEAKGLGKASDLVFTNAEGAPITRHRLLAAVKRAAKLASLGDDLKTKDLRTSFCTAAAYSDMPSIEAAAITGHSPETWQRSYAKKRRSREQAVASGQTMRSALSRNVSQTSPVQA